MTKSAYFKNHMQAAQAPAVLHAEGKMKPLPAGRHSLTALIVAACLAQGCSGIETSPWLDVHLTEEFSRQKADEVRNFADYLALEEQLFAELDAKVYAATPSDPEQRLLRFSPGSASDPRAWHAAWNRRLERRGASPGWG